MAIINNPAVDSRVLPSFDILISSPLEVELEVGLVDHMVVLFLDFEDYPYNFLQCLVIAISTNNI